MRKWSTHFIFSGQSLSLLLIRKGMKLLITAWSKEGFEKHPAGAWAPALNREKCLISEGQSGISMAETFYEAITPLHIAAHGLKLVWSCSACTHLTSPPAWHVWLCKKLLLQFYNPFNSLNSWRELSRSRVHYHKMWHEETPELSAPACRTHIHIHPAFFPPYHNSRGPRSFAMPHWGAVEIEMFCLRNRPWGSLRLLAKIPNCTTPEIRDVLRSLFHKKPGIWTQQKSKAAFHILPVTGRNHWNMKLLNVFVCIFD